MRSVTLTILLGSVARSQANDLARSPASLAQKSMDESVYSSAKRTHDPAGMSVKQLAENLVLDLIARRPMESPFHSMDLDTSTLGKIGPAEKVDYSEILKVDTSPIAGMKPGTSGLRKQVRVWQQPPYLQNFVQACFDALGGPRQLSRMTLVLGGDGRYFNDEALQTIIRMAAANSVAHLIVARGGVISTPAFSAVIRSRSADAGLVLTASHNPGGIDGDFGIKMNLARGEPAVEAVTSAIHESSKRLEFFRDISGARVLNLSHGPSLPPLLLAQTKIDFVDPISDYIKLLRKAFDFNAIRALIARDDFSLVFDAMHGAGGPSAEAVLVKELGAPASCLRRCDPRPDFGGGHPDPNIVYAASLVAEMGLKPDGSSKDDKAVVNAAPVFGAAADGDADRNMILGRGFFVTPSDSVAVLAANAAFIPWFAKRGGLKACARSMPTSSALDRVAAKLGIPCFETPTGWKYFGNLMDSKAHFRKADYTPFLCGEESFGTGADHVREKDGLWAVLAWLSVIAAKNPDPSKPLIGVADIVRAHWAEFGRNFYARYDYEAVDATAADAVMDGLRSGAVKEGDKSHGFVVVSVSEFEYEDPVDGSVAKRQGIIIKFSEGARAVFRLSGTGSVGATVRLYLERHEPDALKHDKSALQELAPLGEAAIDLSNLHRIIGRRGPNVKT